MREDENTNADAVQGNTAKSCIYEMNLFEKMALITAELKTVAKNLEVKAGNSKYSAVSERDIIDAVKPLEEKYRVYSYPSDREILESEILSSESTYNNQTTTKTTFFTRIKTTYKFVNIDDPDESITMITFAEGIDTQDKGSGKAMTYADKYALMKAYKISTGDDPDQDPSNPDNYHPQGNGSQRKPQPPYQGPQQGQQAPRPQQNQGKKEPVRVCEQCGKEILETPLKNGGFMSPKEIAHYSITNFGGVFCPDCQRGRKKINHDD